MDFYHVLEISILSMTEIYRYFVNIPRQWAIELRAKKTSQYIITGCQSRIFIIRKYQSYFSFRESSP